jgi:protoporphyrinogen oxidase
VTGGRSGVVTIAGAGCAGLAAGIALQRRGYQVSILECAGRIGGLAGGVLINGNIYEYGPHIFHTTDPEVLSDVERIAGHVLIPFKKTIRIKFLGKYFAFPLAIRDVVVKLPARTVAHAALSFVWHFAKGAFAGEAGMVNSEKVLQRYYGNVLYKIFFKDYIAKVWGIEPADMSPSFARQRVPRLDPLDALERLTRRFLPQRSRGVHTDGYVEKVEGVNYTTKAGFHSIVEAYAGEFTRNGGTLILNATVTDIHVSGRSVESVTYRTADGDVTLAVDYHISTVPISLLPQMIVPAPPRAVVEAAESLRFRGTIFVGLLVGRKTVLPASFMYFRDKSFNRITDLGHFDMDVKPAGSTILIAEVMAQPSDPIWSDDAGATSGVVRELVAEGLLSEADIVERHTFKTPFAYPIYKVGYETALSTVLDAVASYENLYTIGRQGKFAYINTHIAFKMGYEVARRIDHVRQ